MRLSMQSPIEEFLGTFLTDALRDEMAPTGFLRGHFPIAVYRTTTLGARQGSGTTRFVHRGFRLPRFTPEAPQDSSHFFSLASCSHDETDPQ